MNHFFVVVKTISDWKILAESVVSDRTLDQFKSQLKMYFIVHPINAYALYRISCNQQQIHGTHNSSFSRFKLENNLQFGLVGLFSRDMIKVKQHILLPYYNCY